MIQHMNIYEELDSLECSPTENEIRKLIFHDPQLFMQMRTDTIVQTCHVSRATLYRLCEKLNVDGLAGLKIRLGADLDAWKEGDTSFDYDFPVKEGVSVQSIADSLEKDYNQTVVSTKNLLDNQTMRWSAAQMEKSDAVDIYTSAGNIYFADNFAFQMKEIGRQVNVPHELYLQLLYAASSNASHFAIVISFGGRNWQMEKLCRTLKETKTPILLICSEQAEKLFPYTNHRLYFSPNENHYRKISSFSTRLSLLYILDVLYTCYFERNYDENLVKKTAFYNQLSDRHDPKADS